MIRYLFLIVFLLISIKSAEAEIAKQIIINGNKRVSNETIIIYGEIKKNKNYSDIDLNNVLKNLYPKQYLFSQLHGLKQEDAYQKI